MPFHEQDSSNEAISRDASLKAKNYPEKTVSPISPVFNEKQAHFPKANFDSDTGWAVFPAGDHAAATLLPVAAHLDEELSLTILSMFRIVQFIMHLR